MNSRTKRSIVRLSIYYNMASQQLMTPERTSIALDSTVIFKVPICEFVVIFPIHPSLLPLVQPIEKPHVLQLHWVRHLPVVHSVPAALTLVNNRPFSTVTSWSPHQDSVN